MMKRIEVPIILPSQNPVDLFEVSGILDRSVRQPINIAPWPEFDYTPETSFAIGHDNSHLYLKFFVEEAVLKASFFKPNDPVYKDSCVEFFVAFEDDKAYYNFEFNAIGTCLLGFGENRHNRKSISAEAISKIRYLSSIQNRKLQDGKTGVQWELTLMIPAKAFSEHRITGFSGKSCSANFYKCGDDTPVPHYLAWNEIQSPAPDFHLSEYFGKMKFL